MAKRTRRVSAASQRHVYVTYCIVGIEPLLMHPLLPERLAFAERKTAAEKKAAVRWDPYGEFRSLLIAPPIETVELQWREMIDEIADQSDVEASMPMLAMPATAIKGAILDVASLAAVKSKKDVQRLLHVVGTYIPIWGVPQLHLAVVRTAGTTRAPELRFRPVIPRWASMVRLSWIEGFLDVNEVTSLLVTAGLFSGIGDWRPALGRGRYGMFAVTTPESTDNGHWATFTEIVTQFGRDAQAAAIEQPEVYDPQYAELVRELQDARTAKYPSTVTT